MSRPGYALPANTAEILKSSGIWQPICPVPMERLAAVRIRYLDFDGNVHDDGELIVMDAVAPRTRRLFDELLARRFPIAKVRSIHHYDGDDEKSMEDNNTSCFNFRAITGSNTVSIHGYGLAIDVNPVQNPYITFDESEESEGIAKIHPPEGWSYLNRSNLKPGMLEPVINVFTDNGFTIWGGRWTTPIDYHHFQPPRLVAELLCAMSPEDAEQFFEKFADKQTRLPEASTAAEIAGIVELCRTDKTSFAAKYLT